MLQVEQHDSEYGTHVNGEHVSPEGGSSEDLVNGPEDESRSEGVHETVADDGKARAFLGRIQKFQEGNTVLHEPVENRGASEKDAWVTSNSIEFLEERREVVVLLDGEVNGVVPTSRTLSQISRGSMVDLVLLGPINRSDDQELSEKLTPLIPSGIREKRVVSHIVKNHKDVEEAKALTQHKEREWKDSPRVKQETTKPLAQSNSELLESKRIIRAVFSLSLIHI